MGISFLREMKIFSFLTTAFDQLNIFNSYNDAATLCGPPGASGPSGSDWLSREQVIWVCPALHPVGGATSD